MQVQEIPKQANLPKSEPEVIYHAWQRGEVSEKDCHIMTAMWVASNADKYPKTALPVVAPTFRAHVESRCNGSKGYDQAMAEKTGVWNHAFNHALHQSKSDMSLFLSVSDILKNSGQEDKANATLEFSVKNHRIPAGAIAFAIKAALAAQRDQNERDKKVSRGER